MQGKLESKLRFCLTVSKSLLEAGCPSHRVEMYLSELEEPWDVSIKSLAVPTSIFISISSDTNRITEFERVKSWTVNLGIIGKTALLIREIKSKRLSPDDALHKFEEILLKKSSYPGWFQLFCKALCSGAVALFFGGSIQDAKASFILGSMHALLHGKLAASDQRAYLADFLTATIVTVASLYLSKFTPLNSGLVITCTLITLVPGLIFVNGIHELSVKNLVSGTARLMEALMVGLSLAFGVFVGVQFFKFF